MENKIEERKNLAEFIALIKRYSSISLEEIQKEKRGLSIFEEFDPHMQLYSSLKIKLTGFGWVTSCTLCKAVGNLAAPMCKNCVWYKSDNDEIDPTPCIYENANSRIDPKGDLYETYNAIEAAITEDDLLRAYRQRADYMKRFLKETYNIDYDLV